MALLDFDDSDLRVLNDALVRMPYASVAPLIAKINQQLTERPAPQTSPDGSAVNKDAYLNIS